MVEKKLIEIAALPYFRSPFISIAKNNREEQFAVIFRDTGDIEVVSLPVHFEEIIKMIELKGFKITVSNIHLFEIHNRLIWNYEKIYLDLYGNEIDPFKKE